MRRFPIFRLTHEVIGRFSPQAIYHCPALKQTFLQAGEMPDTPSRVREIAASAMIAVGLVVVVLFNLPASAITRTTAPVVNAIALPLGLDQNWALFAPTPPTRQEDIERSYALGANSFVAKRLTPDEPGSYFTDAVRYWVHLNQSPWASV